jgi:TonB family protein
MITTDEKISGGGSPKGGTPPPPPPPQQQQVAPPPPPPKQEQARVEPTKEEKRDPDSLEAKPTKKLPNVSLTPVKKKTDKSANKTESNTADEQAEAKAEAKRQQTLAAAIRNASQSIRNGTSGNTEIDIPLGPGGGGATYANFYDAVKKVYTEAWILPDGDSDDDATVSASVTIAKDGSVISSKVLRLSGNNSIDRSVQMTLDRVRIVVPLPQGAKESQRTVTIKFNARVKRGLG